MGEAQQVGLQMLLGLEVGCRMGFRLNLIGYDTATDAAVGEDGQAKFRVTMGGVMATGSGLQLGPATGSSNEVG